MEPSHSQPTISIAWICFGLACIALILVSLYSSQKITSLQSKKEPKVIEKVVTQYIALQPENTTTIKAAPPREVRPLPDLPPLPSAYNIAPPRLPADGSPGFTFSPPVSDPLEEKLLREAREARILGDMRAVALKLEEVISKNPSNPHAIFQNAEMFESMGIFDKAAESYEDVLLLGIGQSGDLYRKAAQKLKEGLSNNQFTKNALAIGSVHQFIDEKIETGESVKITIPIISSPEETINPAEVSLSINIFDEIDGEIVPCLPSNRATYTWKNEPRTWQINGEELLTAYYYLPNTPSVDDYDTLGPRKYYGYTIELSYKGRLVDLYAWPRILFSKLNYSYSNLDPYYPDYQYDQFLLPPISTDN